ncbi:PLAT/LH2 domain-containing protein [Bacillus cereus group sp. BfR-BA-01379]|uniref:PLAT/LH2 domain-containing protein n=1 Tax=Bacillus cereus group sp. BfR-BA-01379 TaxID=2920323 RepID=UPI001F575BBF|nr:PLAT/LH2 domain-containing protein [Bacillus cereus group sp. BfR-BA-01379]
MATYKIQFKTGDVKGAGTDAVVLVQLFGGSNYVSPLFGDFNGPNDDFEQGNLDGFVLPRDIPCDDIRALTVRIECNDEPVHDWYLEYIKLMGDNGKDFVFACNRWLGVNSEPYRVRGYTLYGEHLPESERVSVDQAFSLHSHPSSERVPVS